MRVANAGDLGENVQFYIVKRQKMAIRFSEMPPGCRKMKSVLSCV